MKLNRWIYMVVVTIVAIAEGVATENPGVTAMGLALLLPVLTFPLGVVGVLCALPLIYFGVATPSEAHFIAAPVYAVAGMIQWYVLLPHMFAKNFNRQFNLDALPPTSQSRRK
jgi:hypothetical protein